MDSIIDGFRRVDVELRREWIGGDAVAEVGRGGWVRDGEKGSVPSRERVFERKEKQRVRSASSWAELEHGMDERTRKEELQRGSAECGSEGVLGESSPFLASLGFPSRPLLFPFLPKS